MEEKTGSQNHKMILNNRKSAVLSGVTDVMSFDVSEILLETEQGVLLIRGKDLHVNRLTLEKGEIEIDGRVDSFSYSDVGNGNKPQESLFGRLFR